MFRLQGARKQRAQSDDPRHSCLEAQIAAGKVDGARMKRPHLHL